MFKNWKTMKQHNLTKYWRDLIWPDRTITWYGDGYYSYALKNKEYEILFRDGRIVAMGKSVWYFPENGHIGFVTFKDTLLEYTKDGKLVYKIQEPNRE